MVYLWNRTHSEFFREINSMAEEGGITVIVTPDEDNIQF